MITDEMIEKYAKRLFRFAHPKKDWMAHPNYKQLQEQDYWRSCARVLLKELLEGDQ